MSGFRKLSGIGALVIAFLLVGCDGGDNPLGREINEDLEPKIENLDLNRRDIYPGEQLRITWESSEAFLFDARIYFSSDTIPSDDDLLIIDEECSNDRDDHCRSQVEVDWFCRYRNDNSFECEEDNDTISYTDLTTFFDVLPKETVLILQLCNGNDCNKRVRDITFF